MKTRKELLQRKADLVGEMKAIQAKSLEGFTDELQASFDGKKAEVDAIKAQLKMDDEMRELDRAESGTVLQEGIEVSTDAAQTPKLFANFGEQMQAIFLAYSSNNFNVDERLLKINEAGAKKHAAAAGGAAAIGSDGGYLIQSDFTTEILKKAYSVGGLLSRCRRATVSANSDKLVIPYVKETSRATGSRWGGVQTYWADEADTANAKKPQIGKLEVPLHKLIGLAHMTRELLEDASAMSSIYRDAFSEEISFMVENAIINGTGAGQPLGILNSDAFIGISKETGQDPASLVAENIHKMYSRMWAPSRASSIWLHNQDIEPQLFGLNQIMGTVGVPVFLPPNGLSQAPYGSLMGRPLIPSEYSSTLGTLGDILLLDMMQYLLLEKGELRVDISEHVNFTSDQIAMRFVLRVGGQPLWYSAVTPFKGSATKSPYIGLATRA
jgi:HK97 family phage major capsid protein